MYHSAMTSSYETVLNDALHLPLEERSRIATRLIESMDEDDFELSSAWQAEVERRIASIKEGTATLLSHDEAMASVRQKLAQQRAAKTHA
jgi:putative addiction module component (TIGR02574 family)